MSRLIDGAALYERLAELEELARDRVLDTDTSLPYPTNLNPAYTRYSAQLDERIRLKQMIADAPTIETEQKKGDLVDRKEILRSWQNVCIGISCSKCQFHYDDAMNEECLLERWVHSLPSAERNKGEWIQDGHHIQCNQCGISICDKDREGDVLPKKFCPNCGSYNGGEEDDI